MTWSGTLATLLTGNKITGTKLATWYQALKALTDPETSYVPVISATGGGFVIGTGGTITGSYRQAGNNTTGRINIIIGAAGYAAGTGFWNITMPNTMAGAQWDGIGIISIRDVSAGASYTIGTIAASTTTVSGATGAGTRLSGTVPVTFATGDSISLAFSYANA